LGKHDAIEVQAVNMLSKVITLLFSFFLIATPVYAESSFQYSKPIQTNDLAGYKSVILDKEVYAHSRQLQLQDLRIFDKLDHEVPYFLISILDASTTKEKESFIHSEETPYATTQDGNDTVITIEVNRLNGFLLKLNTDDLFERTYVLYGMNGETKWYLSEGTLVNQPLDPSLTIQKDIKWTSTNPFDTLRLVIHNRDNKPLNLKSISFSYYLDKLVFQDLGNTQYRLAYGNDTLSTTQYNMLNYKSSVGNEPLTQATLGAEVSTPPQAQLPEKAMKYKLLFYSTISALALFVVIGIGFSLRRK